MRTDEELKKIARDLYDGKIFTDRHLQSLDELRMVFMVLAFMDQTEIKQMEENKVDMVFEYLDKAGPRAVNGKPCFFSCQTATQDEVAKINTYYKAIKAADDSKKVQA
jgi:hypothetical protein